MHDFLDSATFVPQTVYLIIGRPRHGKTEVGKAIAAVLKCGRGSTSSVVYMALAEEWHKALGVDVLTAFNHLVSLPKESLRPDLIRVGDRLCKDNPAALAVWLVENGNFAIDGIRRKVELDHAKKGTPGARFQSQRLVG